MNSKKKGILIGLIIIALLAIVLVVLELTKPEDDASSESSSLPTYAMIEQDKEALVSLTVKNEEGEFTVEPVDKSEEDSEDEDNSSTEFTIPALSQYEQESSYLLTLASDMSSLNANAKVADSVEDKAKYGLDNPIVTVTANFEEGKQYVLTVGSAAYGGGYYATVSGDDALYTISDTVGDELKRGELYYVSKVLIAAADTSESDAEDTIHSVTITRSDLAQPITMKLLTDENANYESYASKYMLTSPLESDINSGVDANYVDIFVGGTATEIVGYYKAEDAATYGFDNPTATVDLSYNDTTAKFIIGKLADESSNYYVMLEGRDLVYKASEGMLGYANSVTADDLISSQPILPNIAKVATVDVTVDSQTYTFSITNEEEEPEETSTDDTSSEEASEPVINTTGVSYNGKELDIDNFKTYYQLLLSVPAEQVHLDAPTGTPAAAIVYHYTDGKSDTVELYSLGSRRMGIAVNGTMKYEGRSSYIDKLIKETENVINDKEVDTDW